jgi:hypothetical protein
MTQELYLSKFLEECEAEYALTKAKNSDYANAEDAFANFTLVEKMTGGRITTEMGFVVRISDKLQRIANLISHEPNVADEKITDTLRDLGTYSKLFKIYMDSKREMH